MESLAKMTLTLFVLTDPIAVVPLLLASVAGMDLSSSKRFVRILCLFVFATLLATGFFGGFLLSAMDISVGALRVAGGLATLIAGIQILLKNKSAFHKVKPGLCPLGVPLLVGPAAMSYMVAQNSGATASSLLASIVSVSIVCLASFLIFSLALKLGKWLSEDAVLVTEKISAFLLAALSVEMIVSGLRSLFPAIGASAA